MSAPVICSIGCTDPWNGAGLGLDIRAFAELGARCVWVVAGVTAQDRTGLRSAAAISADVVAAQFKALRDAPIAAYRIGALLDAASLEVVADHVARSGVPVVYDPVFGPSAGGAFIDASWMHILRPRLLPHVDVVTPNMAEAAALCDRAVNSLDEMESAAQNLRALGCKAALVTGGHRTTDAIDVLADASGVQRFDEPRLPGTVRGTGCLLAAALAVGVANGVALREAVPFARTFVRKKLAHPRDLAGMPLAF